MRPRLCSFRVALILVGLGPAAAFATPVAGHLGSPAGRLPALTVYAWSLDGAKLHSVTTGSGEATFSLDLPPGRYYVFAAPLDPGAPPIYGAYTEYAACVHETPATRCLEHGLKTLTVGKRAGAPIDLSDWYLEDQVTLELDRILGRPAGGALAEAELAAPKFSEYPVAAFTGARAAALVLGDEPRIERDREPLSAALDSRPNFAGRTVLVRIGCGDSCETVAFVDVPSGRVAYPAALAAVPTTIPCATGAPVKFRRDSRLLTVTNDTGGTRLTRYFLWDAESGVLKLIASLGSAVEEPCTAPR